MKLLNVLGQLPSRTGSGVYFSNIVEGLKELGYEQKAVFALQDNFSFDLLREEDCQPVYFKGGDLEFPIVGMSDVMPYDNTRYSDMTDDMVEDWLEAFREKLVKLKEENDFDLVISHHLWFLSSLVLDVFEGSGVKVLGVCHNTDIRQAEMNPHLLDKYVEDLNRFDMVFSLSEEQKNLIEDLFKIDREKIVSIGGGFNEKIFYPQRPKVYGDKVRLVFSAKIDPSKGIYELVKAYKELDRDNISLDIIGQPDEENHKKLTRLIDGDESIKIYNVKDQKELADELRKKDIFVMPSFFEGLGLMAIESLASGLYVVATEIEALMKLLGDKVNNSGIITYVSLPRIKNVDQPVEEDLGKFREDLKAALEEQIKKVEARKTCLIEQRDNIDKHSWSSLVSKMDKLFRDLVEEKSQD